MTDIALQVKQTRSEHLLGASEAAAVLGLDPYTSPITVWRRHRGMDVAERPAFVQEAAEWGQALEPVVRGKYALARNAAVFVPTQSVVKDEWLRCTPDGLVVTDHPDLEHAGDILGKTHEWSGGVTLQGSHASIGWETRVVLAAHASGNLGLYQGKTCSAYKRDEWVDGVPPAYEVQVRVEMAVTGIPWCDVLCLVGGQKLAGPFRVTRDLALEDRILTDLGAFWRMVQEGREPSPDHTAAWREHVSERMQATKVAIQPSHELLVTIARYKGARTARKAMERDEDRAKNEILLALSAAGASQVDLGDEGKLTAYRTGAKPSWKDYAISLGGAAKVPERFQGKPGSFTLRAPWGDDDE